MPDPLTTPLVFAFGIVIGSFLNVVILRYPKQSINGRSHCPNCHKVLGWSELIPILSFILQRGHCRRCRAEISIHYPLVELAMGLSALILFTPLPKTTPELFTALLAAAAIALLIILFAIDLRTLLLPDLFVILLVITVALQLLLTKASIAATFQGAIVGSGFLALLWLVTLGRGIGIGDIKLMIPLGALFGPTATAVLLFLAFVIGGAVAVSLLATRRATLKTPVPFGPFLAGTAIVFLLAPNLASAIITFALA